MKSAREHVLHPFTHVRRSNAQVRGPVTPDLEELPRAVATIQEAPAGTFPP